MSQGNIQNFRKIFDTFSLKLPNFIYLSLLVERLRRIKVSILQSFEDFPIEAFIEIHSVDDNNISKGFVKLIQRVKVAHSFLQPVVSNLFHCIILSLPM